MYTSAQSGVTLSTLLDLSWVGSNAVLRASSGDGNQALVVFTPLPFLNVYHTLRGTEVLALSIRSVCCPTGQACMHTHSARTHVRSAKAPSSWVLSTDQGKEGAGSLAAFQKQ